MVQTKFYWLIGQPNLDPFDPHNQRPSSSKLFFWLKAHWHECLIETMPTYIYYTCRPFQSQRTCSEHCFASRPVGEASVLTHFLHRQNWRATGVMKVITVSPWTTLPTTMLDTKPGRSASKATIICLEVSPAHVLRGIHSASAVGVCSSSAQAQCKDDDASDKTDLRHEHADTPKLKSVPECLRKRCLSH